MKILLISTSGRLPSDGSRLISALLKQARHQVTNVYLSRRQPDYPIAELERLDDVLKATELVLVAVYSNYAARAERLTDFIHRRYPHLKVVWGGPHCISVPQICLRHADAVCFSEGDQAVVEFVDRFESGGDVSRTPNMALKQNGRIIVNRVLPPFQDLDGLPYYDFGFEDQFLLDGDLRPLDRRRIKKLLKQYPFFVPIVYFLTSRGCPHRCSYCNNCRYISMFGRNTIRFYSPDRIIDEVKHTLDHLGVVEFVGFGDDDFMARPLNEIERFARRYQKEIGLPFGIAASARTFAGTKLEVLLDHGLKVFNMGVQSGSQRVLDDVYRRPISLERTRKVVDCIAGYRKKHRLTTILDFIVDNPYETGEDLIRTYRYLLDLPAWVKPNLFFLSFFPGTPIYDRAVADGWISAFDSAQFRSFTRSSIRYQKNYETFLVFMLRIAKLHPKLRKIPRFIFRLLGSRPLRALARLLPERMYEKGINKLVRQEIWRKKNGH
jgi:radical SAM superfamily enzyme YgiQ (UPF0313 family)